MARRTGLTGGVGPAGPAIGDRLAAVRLGGRAVLAFDGAGYPVVDGAVVHAKAIARAAMAG